MPIKERTVTKPPKSGNPLVSRKHDQGITYPELCAAEDVTRRYVYNAIVQLGGQYQKHRAKKGLN
ncbi:MAG: hypothetical protein LQ343_003757 [Gyalolechia ehrenbergii]|nr:MAG: hypothetical protein LQ343_003757 [Gyalolechia ehrenbergii]